MNMQKYIFCLTYETCINEIYDFFNVIGAEPVDRSVALEPCLLLAAVAAAVALYLEDALVEGGEPVEILEHLLVAHGVQGILRALRVDGKRLLLESGVNHVENARVDAVVEHVARAGQSNLYDVERALLALALAKRGVGLARAVAYLECMHYTAWVVAVDNRPVLGVEHLQFGNESLKSLVGKSLLHPLARLVVDGGYVVDAVAHGVDVHHRAAREQRRVVALEEVGGEQLHHIALVHRRTIVVADVVGANEVVRHSGALCGGGCGGAYGYLLEYLSGVGVDDRYVEVLGNLQAQFCLAYARRTEYYYQCFCHIIYGNKKRDNSGNAVSRKLHCLYCLYYLYFLKTVVFF